MGEPVGLLWLLVGYTALRAALAVALTLGFWLDVDRRPLVEFALRRVTWRAGLFLMGIGAAPVGIALVMSATTGHLTYHGWNGDAPFALSLLAGYVVYSVLIGIAEELPFRGYLLENLDGLLGRTRAVAISTALFTAYHWVDPEYLKPMNVALISLMGLGLAFIRIGTGSLVPAIVAHAAWDFALFILIGDPDVGGILNLRFGPGDAFFGGERSAGAIDLLVTAIWTACLWRWAFPPTLGDGRPDTSRTERPAEAPSPD
jgi:membrane protease YdiL (CAAX protease family)